MHFFTFFLPTTGEIKSAVYKMLIAPLKKDLPASLLVGFSRVCVDHNFAYIDPYTLKANFSFLLPCHLVPLPGTSYRKTWVCIISKIVHTKASLTGVEIIKLRQLDTCRPFRVTVTS